MHSLPYLTVLCGATTAAAGLSLHSDLTDAVADVVDVVDDLADSAGDLIDAAKVIISKIPLSEFGQFEAVSLEEAVADPSLLDMLMKPDDGGSSTTDDATADDGLAVRATFANSSCNAASVSTRIEWSNYSDSDRLAFVDSIACLIETPSAGSHFSPSTNRYEDFVRTHQVLTSQIHHSGQFLLWHRYFVHALEQALRDECGFDRAMPWWDETLDSGAFHQSSLFTADYFGSLPGPVNGNGVCVTDGRFANMTCNIGPGSSNIPHCVSRAVNESLTAQANTDFVEYCEERTDFGSFSNCAEGGYDLSAFLFLFLLPTSIFLPISTYARSSLYIYIYMYISESFLSWETLIC